MVQLEGAAFLFFSANWCFLLILQQMESLLRLVPEAFVNDLLLKLFLTTKIKHSLAETLSYH